MTPYQLIVSCQWLAERLNNPQMAIVDCRFQLGNPDWGYQQYLANHVPGSYYLDLERDLSAPVARHGGRHPLPDPQRLAAKLETMGITLGETFAIAYDDSRFAFAARLWWLLRYLGHDRVALLDGGWKAWQTGKYPTTDSLPEPRSGKFVPQPRLDWLADLEMVKSAQHSSAFVLVDSRDGDRYRGEREPIDPIAGHIRGAVNSPWQQVTDEEGYFYSLEKQAQLWQNYPIEKELVFYCGSGVTACVNLFSLASIGRENVRLYPGGWSDWCSYRI